ncbi:hypothetical protein ACW2Q0_01430 [Nocardia sp. R16R-3T]
MFGIEALLAELADSTQLATFVGEGSRYLWPESYNLPESPSSTRRRSTRSP